MDSCDSVERKLQDFLIGLPQEYQRIKKAPV